MAERFACIDFSKPPKDFRQIALEPGYPLLDRANVNARIVAKWLGRLAAEPERRGEAVSWFVRSEQGARLDGVACSPITPNDLKGALKGEFAELKKRLDAAEPKTRAEQAVCRSLKENLNNLVQKVGRPELDSYFFKYQDEQNKWRLLWVWGCERTEPSDVPTAICVKPECRATFLVTPAVSGKCPHCQTKLPIPPNPWKRLAVAMTLLFLLAGAGYGGWWSMQPRAKLKGVIVWTGNNQPVAQADVRIAGTDFATQTDEAGQFELTRLPDGPAEVEISATGFHPQTLSETLIAGEETSVRVPLKGNGTLKGRVINGVSQVPLDDVVIQVLGSELTGRTNEDGLFRIEGLPGGARQIHVIALGFPEKDVDVELAAAEETEISVPLTGEAILTGQVLNANNEQPISGAKVVLVGTGLSHQSDADGWFVIKQAPAGNATVEVSADGFATERLEKLLAAGKERSERVLLKGAAILSGNVLRQSDNQPLANATIKIEGTRLLAQTDQSGRFSLAGIPSGIVKVEVSAPGYRSVQLDKVLQTGQQTLIEVKLEGGASLAGTVIDTTTGKPVANAEVSVAGSNPLRTDDAGAFRVVGVKAGPTKIEVKAAGLKAESLTADLKPGEETKLTIKLVGDATLTGTVTDALTGKPVAKADLQLVGTTLNSQTDADGKFRLDGPKSGKAQIEIAAKGYPNATFPQALDSGRTTSATFQLTGDSVLNGQVIDLGKNQPVPNAEAKIAGTKLTVKSDAAGKFRFEKLPGLPVTLEINAAGYRPQKVESTLAAGKPTEVKVLLGGDAVLSGEVYDTISTKPIANAQVGLAGTSLSTRSDARGRFRLENVFGGTNNVSVNAAGYAEKIEKQELVAGQETKAVRFGLTGTAVATGKIFTPTGDPIEGAVVKLPGTKHEVKTGRDGAFQLEKLPGGPVLLEVSAEHYKTDTLRGELVADKPTMLDPVKLVSGLAITGEVINALNEKPLPGVKVSVEGTELRATTDAGGSFRLESVPIRPFNVQVEAAGFYPETLAVDPVNGSGQIKPVLVPELNPGELRLVLLWGGQVDDLDLHLYGYDKADDERKKVLLHVSHTNRKAGPATLDVDNRNGYGPETITLKNPSPAHTYQIVVHAYQDPKGPKDPKPTLGGSKAEVRIYQYGQKTGYHVKVSERKEDDKTVWYVGNVKVAAGGAPQVNRYSSFNYDDELPKE